MAESGYGISLGDGNNLGLVAQGRRRHSSVNHPKADGLHTLSTCTAWCVLCYGKVVLFCFF